MGHDLFVQEEDDLLASCTSREAAETPPCSNSLGFFPTAGLDLDFDDFLCSTPTIKEESSNMIIKKLSHNAYERDRRKKMNQLYSSLRSLLPETEQSKKLSIPCTISRVLKYIPELQRHVERLIRSKEEILLSILREGESADLLQKKNQGEGCPVVSATCLNVDNNNREVMMHMCIFHRATSKSFARVLRVLEDEGLQLLNASALSTHSDRTFYSLHLQAKTAISMEGSVFGKHLIELVREKASADD